MRVVVHPADENACGHYRMVWPARAARAQGHDVIIDPDRIYPVLRATFGLDGTEPVGLVDMRAFRKLKELCMFELRRAERMGLSTQPILARWDADLAKLMARTERDQLKGADVVVFQRILAHERFETMLAVQAAGAAVVVEVDDDFHAIHPRNPAWKDTSPIHQQKHNRHWLKRACLEADLVTCTTPALAERYAPHGRVVVVPNCIPERYLAIQHPANEPPLVGWSGSVATHPGDLGVTGGVMQSVLDETGARFHVIGTGEGVARDLGLTEQPSRSGWVPLDDYPTEFARLDVGLVPLKPSAFNEAKSWLKGLEMAALGVPFVASNTTPYRALSELGAGLLADTPGDWARSVRMLVKHRDEEIEQGRELACRYTIEGNAWRWVEAWEQALQNRRGSVAA